MGDDESLTKKWNNFRPSKVLWFWSSVALVIATIVIGFSFGGWVTGGTAQEMAENAADKARAQLVASVCVERFSSGQQFASRLTELKKADSWDREDLIGEGNWTHLTGIEEPVDGAAELCAQKLAKKEVPTDKAEARKQNTGSSTPTDPASNNDEMAS